MEKDYILLLIEKTPGGKTAAVNFKLDYEKVIFSPEVAGDLIHSLFEQLEE